MHGRGEDEGGHGGGDDVDGDHRGEDEGGRRQLAVSLFGNTQVGNTYEHQRVSDGKIQIFILILRRGPCLCHLTKQTSTVRMLVQHNNSYENLG